MFSYTDSLIVAFNKSENDIPCLLVAKPSLYTGKDKCCTSTQLELINEIYGDKATEIWNTLTKEEKS